MSDGRTASPLIRKGQAVLGYDGAMDRERCVYVQFHVLYALATLVSLNAIEKGAWLLGSTFSRFSAPRVCTQRPQQSRVNIALIVTHVMARPFTHTKSVVQIWSRARP